jgi:hypothetical protein
VRIERAKINRIDRSAGRAAYPEESIACGDGGVDRWGEYHRHTFSLALVPCGDQALRVLKHLSVGSAAGGSLFLGDLPTLILHLAAVEAHGGSVAPAPGGPIFGIRRMCGRVRLSSDYSEIKIRLKFAADAPAPNFAPDWNKPPTEPMLVAIRSVDGKRIPKMMKWGLIPHWAKDDRLQYSTFNARTEDFTTKPAFRDAWKWGQRCLVVTDGFYEWKKLDAKG